MLDVPDPHYLSSSRAHRNFRLAIWLSFVALGLMILIFLADQVISIDLQMWGLRPREALGLIGVVTAPLLHASWSHLFSNLVPLGITLVLLLYLYPNSALRLLPAVWLLSGLAVWLVGRQAIHIGASGVVYGLMSFLLVSGFLRRDLRSISVSFMLIFVYGSIWWGLLPMTGSMSYELHLAGTAVGLAGATLFRRWDLPPMREYEWERDERDPNDPS